MPSIAYILIGLAPGLLVGFLWAAWIYRVSAARKEALLSQSSEHLAQSQEQLKVTQAELVAVTRSNALAEAAQLSAREALAQSRQFYETQVHDLKANQEKSLTQLREAFAVLSSDALKQSQPELLRLAEEAYLRLQETARGDLSQRQQAIATLVEPLRQQLEAYQTKLAQSDLHQAANIGEVKKQLETLTQHNQTLSAETIHLRRILSSNQARGRWGEETLRRVIEASGMSIHCDFSEQLQAGESKPDVTVHLPGNRMILIDSKVPDLDFAIDPDAPGKNSRSQELATHAAKLRNTIKALADRNYPRQFPQALDHVILFLPAESLFSAALEADPGILMWAAEKQILLSTPASLIGLLRSVSISWQQQARTENAREITEAAQELLHRVVKFLEHFEKIRNNLEKAGTAYNEAVGSFEKMVRPAGEKLKRLGLSAGDESSFQLEPLEQGLRPPPS